MESWVLLKEPEFTLQQQLGPQSSSFTLLSRPSKSSFKLCMLCKYVFGSAERSEREEAGWTARSRQPYSKMPFLCVAEVPLFTGLWWRGALIATSCFPPLPLSLLSYTALHPLRLHLLLLWEKSPDAVKWAMMTYVDAGLFISLWGL